VTNTNVALMKVFAELVHGANVPGGSFVLNSGDVGLLRSLDALTEREASASAHDGATIAAHAQHVRYGLSLMNEWARDGGDPFSNARWDAAWTTSEVDANQWAEIRAGLRSEVEEWLAAMEEPRSMSTLALCGMIGSVAHLAYHLGAVRQIEKNARGPKDGTFRPPEA